MNLASITHFIDAVGSTWSDGGWLMLPLFLLAMFTYYTALELFFHLQTHLITRSQLHSLSDQAVEEGMNGPLKPFKPLLLFDADTPQAVHRHFVAVRNEYLPLINRRIRFLSIIITAGPLLGLLGTVSGMLTTFSRMVDADGNRFNSIATGISEALITTQTGLIISIPAMIILALILRKRNLLEQGIARLERFNTRLSLTPPSNP